MRKRNLVLSGVLSTQARIKKLKRDLIMRSLSDRAEKMIELEIEKLELQLSQR